MTGVSTKMGPKMGVRNRVAFIKGVITIEPASSGGGGGAGLESLSYLHCSIYGVPVPPWSNIIDIMSLTHHFRNRLSSQHLEVLVLL